MSESEQDPNMEVTCELVQSSADSLHGICTEILKVLELSDAFNFEEASLKVTELLKSVLEVFIVLPNEDGTIPDLNLNQVSEPIHLAITSQDFIRTIMSCQQCIQTHEDVRINLLQIAYVSIISELQYDTTETHQAITDWIHCGLMVMLNSSFDPSCSTDVRKAAFDLSYKILNEHTIKSTHLPACGLFCTSQHDLSTIRVFLKLLVSFIVTTPAHLPYMPVVHYAMVCWPVVESTTCAGKTRSILSLNKHEVKATDAQCKTPRRGTSREPWVDAFTLHSFIELERVILEYSASLTETERSSSQHLLAEVRNILQGLFTRFASIGSQLLRTNKALQKNADECSRCQLKFTYFSVALSVTSITLNKKRHHCRVCQQSICDSCGLSHAWLGKRVCVTCCESLVRLDLLEEKRLFSATADDISSSKGSTNDTTRSSLQSAQNSLLSGEHSDDELDGPGGLIRCCSVLIDDDLRAWRDDEPVTSPAVRSRI